MPIELNPLETARFGIVAARVNNVEASPEAIETAARDQGVQMLTVRIPTQDLARVQDFEAAGYRLMDTLVCYSRSLDDLPPRPAPSDGLSCRQAVPEDAGVVAGVARGAFTGYLGHYHADPRIDRAAADAAYVEWAESSVMRASPAAPVLVAESEGRIVGFLTLRSNSSEEMELVLSAVNHALSGRGAYAMLVSEALALGAARGFARVRTSTQINNYSVQRVWARLGFVHSSSLYTLHKWI
jgi:GNAT superfamily N-acetyltransferase